ncbi:hypothetical protein [Massilia aquatica]|uniref:Uncharacterized protein n=1 Tax=Massilia aquatica TaxID=2609000 RepID=A0ABX0LW28_9BURK|nr:hypothetical protein [Massilia aquatica]NHZ38663.1 hypothetical protein [Massilia aquatica]
MAHKKSLGRKASDEARRAAQELVDTYGPALSSPDGQYCINPSDLPEDQTVVTAEQAAHALLEALTLLASTGWLVDTTVSLDRFVMREDYQSIRKKTQTTKEALEELGKKHHRSVRDLQRQVGSAKR